MLKTYPLKTQSAGQITLISLVALILGHTMLKTYFPNEILNIIGLFITAYYIFYKTLYKNDLFSFLMVMYFCSTFPYLVRNGGGFNLVSFVCIGLFFIIKNKFPTEKKQRDIWFKIFVGLLILSSFLGWIYNYTGKGLDFAYSFVSFFGIVFLLITSSGMKITHERIKIFLHLNVIIIIYSTLASINKYIHFITFNTPMMPIYGEEGAYFEGGGLIGSSPFYGEHSLILLILFLVIFSFGRQIINVKRSTMLVAAIVSYINIFMSISRSVFLLSFGGLALIFLLQFKLVKIKISRYIQQAIILVVFTFLVLYIVKATGINYVFERVQNIEESNVKAGGITIDRILDGSAFNRKTAFTVAKEKYESKDSWLIGYGWGIQKNNREAFYVDPSIKRGSAHSQYLAILFLFGWIGSIGYWGLILLIIYRSYKIIGNKRTDYLYRVLSYFFLISFCLFIFNEIKMDCIYLPHYFSITIIWLGLAYSVYNSTRQKPFRSGDPVICRSY